VSAPGPSLSGESLTFAVEGRALVDRVSVAFAPGKLNLILGPNGAGKSTLLKLLSRQMAPSAGVVRYGGQDAHGLTLQALARLRATLSQSVDVAFPLRVWEVVMMGRYPHFTGRPDKADEAACDEVMDLFEVAAFANRDYQTLSGGEQQRVQFARVLAQLWTPRPGEGRYLLLDEPLTFLDIHYQLAFLATLRKLLALEDLVVVGVLHDLNLAARFGDHLVLLHEGRLLAAGGPDEVLTEEHLHTAFRVRPHLVRQERQRPLIWFE
jgi:iron complex transport system ATP-binding protein